MRFRCSSIYRSPERSTIFSSSQSQKASGWFQVAQALVPEGFVLNVFKRVYSGFVTQVGFRVWWIIFFILIIVCGDHGNGGNWNYNSCHDVHGCHDNHSDSYHMTSHRSLPLSLDLAFRLQNRVNSTNGVHLERSWQSSNVGITGVPRHYDYP